MALTLHDIFTAAHKVAKGWRTAFATYREAFRSALRETWRKAKKIMRRNALSEEVRDAARIIANKHYFDGRNRKVESYITWKLGQLLSTDEERRQAREYAVELEREDEERRMMRGPVNYHKFDEYNCYNR